MTMYHVPKIKEGMHMIINEEYVENEPFAHDSPLPPVAPTLRVRITSGYLASVLRTVTQILAALRL